MSVEVGTITVKVRISELPVTYVIYEREDGEVDRVEVERLGAAPLILSDGAACPAWLLYHAALNSGMLARLVSYGDDQ